jgi:hypothetical protein
MNEQGRRDLIERELAAAEKNGNVERILIPWKGGEELLPVVKIALDAIVLNPHSHRIKAQLLSHPKRVAVDADPFSSEAQDLIAQTLRDTEGFDELRVNLREEGQRDPGVMTRAGLLVNANTRAVALRDNEAQYIRVAVLPEGATQKEVGEVELRLQIKKELKQEYTFTNRLLFIEELFDEYGYSEEKIALAVGYAASSDEREVRRGSEDVRQDIRLLSLIRETMTSSDGNIQLTFFDDKRQILLEIDQSYQKLRATDPAAALRLRHIRLVGMLSGVGYRELRHVDQDFYDAHLRPALSDSPILGRYAEALAAADQRESDDLGLDILGERFPAARQGDGNPQPLLDVLLRTHSRPVITLPAEDGDGTVDLPRESVLDELRGSIEGAVEELKADKKRGDRLTSPSNLLKEALHRLERSRDAYRQVKREETFSREKYNQLLKKMERATNALREEFDRDNVSSARV